MTYSDGQHTRPAASWRTGQPVWDIDTCPVKVNRGELLGCVLADRALKPTRMGIPQMRAVLWLPKAYTAIGDPKVQQLCVSCRGAHNLPTVRCERHAPGQR